MIEIEIKAKVPNLELIKNKLEELKAKFIKTEKQSDRIFGRDKDLDKNHYTIDGRFSARIREKGEERLVEFKEINRIGACMEFSSPLSSLKSGLNFLNKLDYKEAFSVIKVRDYYKYQGFEICLDSVEKLGSFIEIEHPCKDDKNKTKALEECKTLLNKIVPDATIEPRKYGDLMQEYIDKKKKII